MEFERKTKPGWNINVIPLIDVIFLLVIFFVIAGSLEPPDLLPIDVPQSDTAMDAYHDDPIDILLTTEGDIIVNHVPATEWTLANAVRYRLKLFPDQEIVVKADATLPARRFVDILRILSEAGATNLAVATRKADS